MAFDIRGHDILSYGEFVELTKNLRPGAEAPVLAAWFAGERISPATLYYGLVKASLVAENDRAHELISVAVRRLTDAFDVEPFSEDFPPPEEGEL